MNVKQMSVKRIYECQLFFVMPRHTPSSCLAVQPQVDLRNWACDKPDRQIRPQTSAANLTPIPAASCTQPSSAGVGFTNILTQNF